jgi:hypothetical protein
LGLAPASLATGFSQRWGASFSLRRLGAAHRSLRPCGGLRKLRETREVLAAFVPVARAPFALLHGADCERSLENSPCDFDKLGPYQINCGPKHFSTSKQSHSRSKSAIMPLIELAPRGKDVSLSLTLAEEIANDVKLYARFLKASHQSAVSDIISECVRRTLKQDAEFQTWKANPENTKTNRGGARPRKTGSPTPPQTK